MRNKKFALNERREDGKWRILEGKGLRLQKSQN